MSKKEQGKQQAAPASPARERLSSVIVTQLLEALGRPATLFRVDVRHLWEDYYRANVLVGADAASTRIAHSFFLATGADGNILASTPGITRKY